MDNLGAVAIALSSSDSGTVGVLSVVKVVGVRIFYNGVIANMYARAGVVHIAASAAVVVAANGCLVGVVIAFLLDFYIFEYKVSKIVIMRPMGRNKAMYLRTSNFDVGALDG